MVQHQVRGPDLNCSRILVHCLDLQQMRQSGSDGLLRIPASSHHESLTLHVQQANMVMDIAS